MQADAARVCAFVCYGNAPMSAFGSAIRAMIVMAVAGSLDVASNDNVSTPRQNIGCNLSNSMGPQDQIQQVTVCRPVDITSSCLCTDLVLELAILQFSSSSRPLAWPWSVTALNRLVQTYEIESVALCV